MSIVSKYQYYINALLLFATVTATSCATRKKVDYLGKDIFKLQTRLLQLENSVYEGGKTNRNNGDATNRTLASTTVKLNKIQGEIQKLKGLADGLQVGVQTGKMPGSDPAGPSIANKLETLSQRLLSVEQAQADILKNMLKPKKKTTSKRKRTPLRNFTQAEKAFKNKHYKHIVEDHSRLLRGSKGNQKNQLEYLYAESLFKLGNIRDAALTFNKLQGKKGLKSKSAQIQLRLGDCFRLIGDKEASSVFYQELVEKHPSTEAAKRAKKHLKKM